MESMMCGECNWPKESVVSLKMTSEEVERLKNTYPGETFHFRGTDYLYAGKHEEMAQWVLFTENQTFIVKEED